MDIALTGVAVLVTLDGAERFCRDIRLALGAVGPTPFLVGGLEDFFGDMRLDDAFVTSIIKLASNQASPIGDLRATADYRGDWSRSSREDACSWHDNGCLTEFAYEKRDRFESQRR